MSVAVSLISHRLDAAEKVQIRNIERWIIHTFSASQKNHNCDLLLEFTANFYNYEVEMAKIGERSGIQLLPLKNEPGNLKALLMEMQEEDRKAKRTEDQIALLEDQMRQLRVRLEHAEARGNTLFTNNRDMQLSTLERVRDMFKEYYQVLSDKMWDQVKHVWFEVDLLYNDAISEASEEKLDLFIERFMGLDVESSSSESQSESEEEQSAEDSGYGDQSVVAVSLDDRDTVEPEREDVHEQPSASEDDADDSGLGQFSIEDDDVFEPENASADHRDFGQYGMIGVALDDDDLVLPVPVAVPGMIAVALDDDDLVVPAAVSVSTAGSSALNPIWLDDDDTVLYEPEERVCTGAWSDMSDDESDMDVDE